VLHSDTRFASLRRRTSLGHLHTTGVDSEWFRYRSCTVEGNVRVIKTTSSGDAEEILTNDPSFDASFIVLRTGLPVHLGVIDVIEIGPNDSLWFIPRPQTRPLALIIGVPRWEPGPDKALGGRP